MDEFRPQLNDRRWKQMKNIKSYKYGLEYRLDSKLIKEMKQFTIKHKKSRIKIRKPDDKLAIVYLAENKKTGERYIGYTTNYLLTFIKMNLYKRNIGEQNVFDNFVKPRLIDITFKLIEFVKYSDIRDLRERRDKLSERYIKEDVNVSNDKFYFKRMSVVNDVIDQMAPHFHPFTGHIYKLENRNTKRVFIGGFEQPMTKAQFFEKALDASSKLEGTVNDYDMTEIEQYHAKTPFDFMIRIDYFKKINKSVDEGYNQYYCTEESEQLFASTLQSTTREHVKRMLFLKFNKHLFEKEYKDKRDYDNIYGFVYMIKNKRTGERFFSYIHGKTLEEQILTLYNYAMQKSARQSKISKALAEYPFTDFEFRIVKVKTEDNSGVDLEGESKKLIQKYDTINNGYNIDQADIKRKVWLSQNIGRNNNLM